MAYFVYPPSWFELRQKPSARFELLGFVSDIVDWNKEGSRIKAEGADDFLGFFYDTYAMDQGVDRLVGEIIFQDESKQLEDLVGKLSRFLDELQRRNKNLHHLHEVLLPTELVSAATALYQKFKDRGLPEYVGSQETVPKT